MKPQIMKSSPTNLLCLAYGIAALAGATGTSQGQTSEAAPPDALITPAQWLQLQPKPMFKPGHTMPALTRYGWDLSYETHKVLAEDWHNAWGQSLNASACMFKLLGALKPCFNVPDESAWPAAAQQQAMRSAVSSCVRRNRWVTSKVRGEFEPRRILSSSQFGQLMEPPATPVAGEFVCKQGPKR